MNQSFLPILSLLRIYLKTIFHYSFLLTKPAIRLFVFLDVYPFDSGSETGGVLSTWFRSAKEDEKGRRGGGVKRGVTSEQIGSC